MYTLKVNTIEKVYSPADNADVLEVSATLMGNPDEPIVERKLAFPLSMDKEELKNELQKYVDNYNLEYKQSLENAERDRQQAQADDTIAEVNGMEFTQSEE